MSKERGEDMIQRPPYPQGVAFVEGRYTDMAGAKISVLDWGFLRSDATYDVVHVWNGRFFRLDKHLERFRTSVERLRMTLPYADSAITDILRACVQRAGLEKAAYVEMIMTRGRSPTFSRDPRDAIGNFMAFAIPFSWIANAEQRERGLSIAIASISRIPPESVDSTIKNYHWLDLIAGLYEAFDRGCESVVLVDGAGNVTEGPGFNIFAVKNGRLSTPDRGVLHGITRQTVFDLCRESNLEIQAGPLAVKALREADEVFLSSTAGGIVPITRIDGDPISDGRPGPLSQRLTKLYWEKHSEDAWTTPVAISVRAGE
jgi:branched-subunit amino acid aminotransferase/4-amino-4-deoxychorismate lyase